MGAQGWAAVALAVGAAVVTGGATVMLMRRLLAADVRRPAMAGMPLARRLQVTRQVRSGLPVADQDLPVVRAVALELSGQRALALVFAGTTALFAAQALFPLYPPVLRAFDAVVAPTQALPAALFALNASRARRWLAAHPDRESGAAPAPR